MKRIVYVVNPPEFFVSHRLALALKAKEKGFEVFVITPRGDAVGTIQAAGIAWYPMRFDAGGMNPLRDIITFFDLYVLFRKLRPDIVHNVTIKPILYGTLAARIARVPRVVNAVSGLGYLFTGARSAYRVLGRLLLRLLLRHRNMTIIVQNAEDRKFFEDMRIADSDRIVLIRGSGVDIERFRPRSMKSPTPIVIQVSRMLADKGVREFIVAAGAIRARRPEVRFQLVGPLYPGNPSYIAPDELRKAEQEGAIAWLGHRDDIPELLGAASVYCMASYREGLPKSVLEAAACAMPIVASDIAGCREIIQNGHNGFLVPVADSVALAAAIEALLDDRTLAESFGQAARATVEKSFALDLILSQQMALYG